MSLYSRIPYSVFPYSAQDAAIAFTPAEIDTLQALLPTLEGKTALQKNPHPPQSLAWAAWIIAKLGGWDGYPKSTPQDPSPSDTDCSTSSPSPADGRFEMCESPSPLAGRRLG